MTAIVAINSNFDGPRVRFTADAINILLFLVLGWSVREALESGWGIL